MNETYRLIDTTLNMVIIRLGDVLLKENNQDFLHEVEGLGNYSGWMQAEREFRLCQSLRATLRETETLHKKLIDAISAKDWNALLQQMSSVLHIEGEVAQFVGSKFIELSNSGRSHAETRLKLDNIRQKVKKIRNALIKERQKLIKQEVDLYNIVI